MSHRVVVLCIAGCLCAVMMAVWVATSSRDLDRVQSIPARGIKSDGKARVVQVGESGIVGDASEHAMATRRHEQPERRSASSAQPGTTQEVQPFMSLDEFLATEPSELVARFLTTNASDLSEHRSLRHELTDVILDGRVRYRAMKAYIGSELNAAALEKAGRSGATIRGSSDAIAVGVLKEGKQSTVWISRDERPVVFLTEEDVQRLPSTLTVEMRSIVERVRREMKSKNRPR